MADTIGTAYVQIEPSFEGVTGKIEKEFGGEGEKSGKSFASGFGSVVGGVSKAVVGAAAAGAAAVAGLAKSAVSSFSDYEQLAGGTELLFGRTEEETEALRKSMLDTGMSARQVADELANMSDASDTVMQNASTAFSRVQMSMNDYLQQANSYATGLKESLGGDAEAAAELTDKIITAQADIVAATGNNAENVANAFAGIMKNNFTMLDNLQLGIKPTKEGMQEVIDKMNELNGTKYEMGNLADMQAAIVDYVEYVGMAGYAQNEAAATIQGSLASTKAAWQDLMTSLGTGDSDAISSAINNLVETASQLGANIMPILQNALGGIAQVISQLAPQIAAALPDLITSVLPGLLSAGVEIVQTLADGILQALPTLMPTITQTILSLVEMIISMAPMFLQAGVQIINELALGLVDAIPTLIPMIVQVVTELVNTLISNAPMLIDAAIQLIQGLATGLLQAIPVLIQAIPTLITSLIDALIAAIPMLVDGMLQLMTGILENLPTIIQALIEAIPLVITAIINALPTLIPMLIQGAIQLVGMLITHLPEIIASLIMAIPDILLAILDAFMPLIEGLGEIFSQAWEGIKGVFSDVGGFFADRWNEAKEGASVAWDAIKEQASTSWEATKTVWSEVGSFFADRWNETATGAQTMWNNVKSVFSVVGNFFKTQFTNAFNNVKNVWNKITDFFSGIWDSIKSVFADAGAKFLEVGRNIVEGIKNGIAGTWDAFKTWLSNIFGDIVALAKKILGIASPSKVMAQEVGRWLPAGIAVGIQNGMGVLNNEIKKMADDMLVGTITASKEVVNSVHVMSDSGAAAGGSVVINNNIHVDGAQDPEAWTQTFISTLKREARMA